MDEQVMKKLYKFNRKYPQGLPPSKPKSSDKAAATGSDVAASNNTGQKRKQPDLADNTTDENIDIWGGYRTRVMLHCLYTVSMLCLLRYQEALNIRWEDITFGVDAHGLPTAEIKLHYRKTHQLGSECFRCAASALTIFSVRCH